MAASVRLRTRGELCESQPVPALSRLSKDRSDAKQAEPVIGELFWVVATLCFLIAYSYIHYGSHQFPNPKSPESGDPTREFMEARARHHLEVLSSYGLKEVGQHSHEILAPRYIVQELEAISRHSEAVHDVEIDEQRVSGCFFLAFRGGCVCCHHNLTNVVARISPKSGARYSLLLNCHYDTAISSPGASDDVISCAMMLELLRVMSSSKVPFRHSVVFLFNGAEEAGLQGSHGFITQHRWSKNIRAFVNLEAAGSGGLEFVFQTGPEHPWLINAYARAVAHPSASVIGQEIFQSGAIPSDTDFRIFRDFGGLPGIDIAYVYNGYVYHTKYDVPRYIPPGCIQRGGENMLALLRSLADSDEVIDPGSYLHGSMVFFDVAGLFMVVYSESLGEMINYFFALCVLIWTARGITRSSSAVASGTTLSGWNYIRLLAGAWLLQAAAIVSSLFTAAAVAALLTIFRPQSWYTRAWLIVPLFVVPSICSWVLCHQVLGRLLFPLGIRAFQREEALFRAALLTWTTLLLTLTSYGLASAYLPMLFVAFPLAIRLLPALLSKPVQPHDRWRTVALTAASTAPPTFIALCQFYLSFILFVPLTGRLGSSLAPDFVIGLLAAIAVIVCSLNLGSLLHISRDLRKLVAAGYAVGAITIFVAVLTPVGFPYGNDVAAPTPQRHILQHVQSRFYDKAGHLIKDDSSLFYLPVDYNGLKSLVTSIPELENVQLAECNPGAAYCGWPYYFPTIRLHEKVYRMPLPPHPLSNGIRSELQLKEKVSNSTYRLHFVCSGHVNVNVYISPKPGIVLRSWSFIDQVRPTLMPRKVSDRPHYFVYNIVAKRPHGSLHFWIDLEVNALHSNPPVASEGDRALVDIGFAAHYHSGPDSMTPPLQRVVDSFPEWTAPLAWVVSYQAFEF